MPGIRGLCKRFKAPAAPPHIFAGVSSILTIPPPDAESVDNNHLKRLRNLSVEALVVAVYILVRTRLSGVETDPKDYTTQRDKAVAAMSELREDHDPLIELELSDVDSWMREIGQGRWTEMDWFENIGEGTGLAVNKPRAASNDTSLDSDVDEDDNLLLGRHKPAKYTAEKPYLQPGLGTMVSLRFP